MEIKAGLLRQYAVVFIVNLSMLTTGMSLSWPSPVLVKLKDPKENPLTRIITEDEGSWMVSLGFLFTPVSNVLGSMLLDTIGRKYSLLVGSVMKLVMGILLICVKEVWVIIFARTVMLISDCFICTIVPIYASEIACKEQHDALGSFLQIFTTFGAVLTLSVGPYTTYITFNIIFTSVIAITTLPLLFLPQSPFFLYSKGQIQKAFTVLESLRGSKSLAKEEIEGYKVTETCETKDGITLLKDAVFLKSLAFALLVGIGSQIIGLNAILCYLQTILISTKTKVKPELGSVLIGIIQVVAACCTYALINRFGRRAMLFWTLGGFFLGMLGLGTFFKITEPDGYQIAGFINYLPLISLVICVYCYSAGIGTLLWPIIAEAFDGPSRALGVSIALLLPNVLIFLTTKYTPHVSNIVGPAPTYWFFAAMTALFAILLAIFLPINEKKESLK